MTTNNKRRYPIGSVVILAVITLLSTSCTLYAWGFNNIGNLGVGDIGDLNTPTLALPGNNAWDIVSAGESHTCAIADGGGLFCWGNNAQGELGIGQGPLSNPLLETTRPVRVTVDNNWLDVSVGLNFTCGIRGTGGSGDLYCWGNNQSNQLGFPGPADEDRPVRVGTASDWSSVSAGNDHACGQRAGGTYCWGWNAFGQLGDGTTTTSTSPVFINALTLDPVAGANHTCADGIGTLYCWGWNAFGQLGDGTTTNRTTLVSTGLSSLIEYDLGLGHTCALQNTRIVSCWGWNGEGQVGDGTTTNRLTPTAIGPAGFYDSVATGSLHTCAKASIFGSSGVYCWGDNANGALGDGTTTDRLTPAPFAGTGTNWSGSLSSGSFHTCAVRSGVDAGEMNCWGEGSDGQLGSGSTTDQLLPEPLALLEWQSVAQDGFDTCAVATNLELWCTGAGGFEPVPGPQLWLSVEAAYTHHCGRTFTGELYCWGTNLDGELGVPGITFTGVPTQVGTGGGWVDVAPGGTYEVGLFDGRNFTCGIRSPGELWCWGDNSVGQLGTGTGVGSNQPVQVGTDADWASISAGIGQACAIKDNGTLWCWGTGTFESGVTSSPTPTQIGNATNWKSITLGGLHINTVTRYDHLCGVRNGGALWCWGDNTFGQLGLGTTTDEPSPTRLGFGWASVDAGYFHTCGRKATGESLCWGRNDNGQLGDGTNTDSLVPVAVSTTVTFDGLVAEGSSTFGWGS